MPIHVVTNPYGTAEYRDLETGKPLPVLTHYMNDMQEWTERNRLPDRKKQEPAECPES